MNCLDLAEYLARIVNQSRADGNDNEAITLSYTDWDFIITALKNVNAADAVRIAIDRAIDEDNPAGWQWLQAWWYGEASDNDPLEGPWHPQVMRVTDIEEMTVPVFPDR